MHDGNPSLVTLDYYRFAKFANANTSMCVMLI